MASTTPTQKPGPKQMTPQPTGFSQMQSRTTGESQGHGMSVLLSWHEKVCIACFPLALLLDLLTVKSSLKSPALEVSCASCLTEGPSKILYTHHFSSLSSTDSHKGDSRAGFQNTTIHRLGKDLIHRQSALSIGATLEPNKPDTHVYTRSVETFKIQRRKVVTFLTIPV